MNLFASCLVNDQVGFQGNPCFDSRIQQSAHARQAAGGFGIATVVGDPDDPVAGANRKKSFRDRWSRRDDSLRGRVSLRDGNHRKTKHGPAKTHGLADSITIVQKKFHRNEEGSSEKEGKKNPQSCGEGEISYYPSPLKSRRDYEDRSVRFSGFRIDLLPAPSHEIIVQWLVQVSSPVTAAGPRRICTVFPFTEQRSHSCRMQAYQNQFSCQEKTMITIGVIRGRGGGFR